MRILKLNPKTLIAIFKSSQFAEKEKSIRDVVNYSVR